LEANSPESLAATKRLLAGQNKQWPEAAIARALEPDAKARETADFKEGIAAFLEKRKPSRSKEVKLVLRHAILETHLSPGPLLHNRIRYPVCCHNHIEASRPNMIAHRLVMTP